MANLDRNEPAACARVAEALLPEVEDRTTFARILASDAQVAGSEGEGRWAVTLGSRSITMNVGAIYCTTVRERAAIVHLVVERDRLAPDVRSKLDALGVNLDEEVFQTQSGTSPARVPVGVLRVAWPLLQDAHAAAVKRAARWKCRYVRSHSPGVVTWVEALIGAPLVAPPQAPIATPSGSVLDILQRAFRSAGLAYEDDTVAAFYTALQAKGFVILSGISGTGKTKLIQQLARLLGQPTRSETPEDRAKVLFLPVRPDWRDSRALLGYFNPITQRYVSTAFIEFVAQAVESWRARDGRAWIVVLDEMNLARVEYYFADVLSVMESGRADDGLTNESLTLDIPAGLGDGADTPPDRIPIPPNLFVVGTVNVDETTHAFSPKVLDRAFSIDLTEVDFSDYPSAIEDAVVTSEDRARIVASFTGDGKFPRQTKQRLLQVVTERPVLRDRLQNLNELLREHDMHFGYRVFDEIVAFVDAGTHNGTYEKGDSGGDAAFDAAVSMKVLPKFHGSRGKLEKPLLSVLRWCANPDDVPEAGVFPSLDAVVADLDPRPLPMKSTAARVRRMLRALSAVGFASFG